MAIVYAGIDGTGENDNDSYSKTFANSFVSRYYRSWPYNDRRFYHRGPQLLGTTTADYAREAFKYILWATDTMGCRAIFLAGYSRGGAAAIEIAKWLKEVGKEVECLILFDAVDRTNTVGGILSNTPIVSTVKHVIHAMRMPETRSRESFGNCGTRYEAFDPTRHHEKKFYATHGGMGGTPWPKPEPVKTIGGHFVNEGVGDGRTWVPFEQDKIGSQQVWNWVDPQVQKILRECQRRLKAPARDRAVGHPLGLHPLH